MRPLAALLLVLLATAGHARTVYIHEAFYVLSDGLREYDVDTGLLVREGGSSAQGHDLAVAPDATPFLGRTCVVRYDWLETTVPSPCWFGARSERRAWDIAFRMNGDLVALEELADPPSFGFDIVRPDGTIRSTHRPPPGLGLFGLDVPRAGPHENGVIAVAVETAAPGRYFLVRWKATPTGELVMEPPIGPLDLMPYWECAGSRLGCAQHLTMRRSGETFLLPDPQRHQVRELNLDGVETAIFADVPEDPVAAAIPPAFTDCLSNIAVDADDNVFVLTQRHAYSYAADGTLLRRFDDIMRLGIAVTFSEWIPFASESTACEPWSVGFWKRQCASLGQSRRAARTRHVRMGALPMPPLHPEFRDGRLEEVIARADGWLAPHGVSTCAALQPESPSDWLRKALRRYATVALNAEDKRLGMRCTVRWEGVERTVGDVLDDVRSLLASHDEEDHRRAFRLCGLILQEEGE